MRENQNRKVLGWYLSYVKQYANAYIKAETQHCLLLHCYLNIILPAFNTFTEEQEHPYHDSPSLIMKENGFKFPLDVPNAHHHRST